MPLDTVYKSEILDSLGEGLFTVDKNFKINFFNKAAEKITGYNRDDVIGKYCKHVFKSELCFSDCPIALVLKSTKNLYDFESKIVSRTGEKIPIKLNSAVLYSEAQEPVGGVISFRDLSELEKIKSKITKEKQFHGVIGHGKKMREIFELIREVSDSSATILIHGESGTGKEMIANAIVKASARANQSFLKINCAVFPENLLGSELFGHVKGAFTDAVKDRPGRFELADKGTLFLDEVAEMPLQMQIQLLRVLQEGTFERIGESKTRKVDVRVIAATNIDIDKALKNGTFREDLYYRLNVIPIHVPPLRERVEDIPLLIEHFLAKFSIIYKKHITELDDETMEKMLAYYWGGNVRELENVLEFMFVRTSAGQKLTAEKLPRQICDCKEIVTRKAETQPEYDVLPEKRELIRILEEVHWNKSKAAELIGVGRTTLWRKLKKYGLD
ncbi:MAG: hypothetical protein SCALA702_07550 [Melioribacteraceae bacterium]|nr:MAG: hypothetical protein SCALA702_07550 [Melioribacteraceae bacterium]